MTKKNLLVFFLFILISGALEHIFFHNLRQQQFYFFGDQFFRFSFQETFANSFFLRKWGNLSLLNCWQMMTQFWDIVYYLLIYTLHIPPYLGERILFFVVLSFSFIASY